ncbi:MAG: nucleotide exchange factor GrpE [Elusimicrobia bacterium]|nr:nucleotide exchange factor GrpE [Elusimicrobiota bacterium]
MEEKLAELAILQESLKTVKEQAVVYYDQLLRLKAEFENYQKRVEKEKVEARRFGKEEVLLRIVGLVDVLEQAISQAERATDVRGVRDGLGLLHQGVLSFLKDEGLTPIESVGCSFNPLYHEAVEQLSTSDGEDGMVLGEVQRGYLFQGRVFRPAKVRVARRSSGEGPKVGG